MIRAVLYDHDGTLVDSLRVVVGATNAVLRARGLPEERGEVIIADMVYPTAPRMGRHAHTADAGEQRRLANEFYAAARTMVPEHVNLYPDVPAMLAAAAMRGLRQSVVSNNEGAFVRAVLGSLRLAAHFSCLYGEEDIPATKPDPRGLLQAAAVMDVPVAVCCYVGDSAGDCRAAHAAGMAAIGVTWGIHRRDEMTAMGFDVLIDRPGELAAVLSRL